MRHAPWHFIVVLSLCGCNALVGIEPGILDACLEDPDTEGCDGGAQAGGSGGQSAGAGGAGGASTSSVTSSSTGAGPACGDGMIDPGEECDDQNAVAGDGCTGCVVNCDGGAKDPATHHCYRRVEPNKQWPDAVEICDASGEHLAAITSEAELSFVTGHIANDFWIGGVAMGGGAFAWSNGEPWSFAPWKDGPPTDWAKRCVKLKDAKFEGDDCDHDHAFLCERWPAGEQR